MLILATHFPTQYKRVMELVQTEPISIPTAEQWEFGVTHAEIGAYLLGLWGIPAPILKVVSLHHRPRAAGDAAFSPLLAVHLADVFSGMKQAHPLLERSTLDIKLLEEQGFSPHLERWQACFSENPLD